MQLTDADRAAIADALGPCCRYMDTELADAVNRVYLAGMERAAKRLEAWSMDVHGMISTEARLGAAAIRALKDKA